MRSWSGAGNGPLIVVDVAVPEPELVRRLAGRRICSKCGTNADRARTRTACGKCGGELVQRADDDQDVVLERLKVYQQSTKPVLEYYRERPTFRVVNGAQAPERVASRAEHDDRRRGGGKSGEGAALVIVCRSQARLKSCDESTSSWRGFSPSCGRWWRRA